MRRPCKIRIREDPSRERRMRLGQLRKTVRAGLYSVPAETVANGILRHFGFEERRELSHQQR